MPHKHLFGLADVPPALLAGVSWEALRFALRTTAASLAALDVAFRLRLRSPADLFRDEPLRRHPFFLRLSALAALHRHIARMRA